MTARLSDKITPHFALLKKYKITIYSLICDPTYVMRGGDISIGPERSTHCVLRSKPHLPYMKYDPKTQSETQTCYKEFQCIRWLKNEKKRPGFSNRTNIDLANNLLHWMAVDPRWGGKASGKSAAKWIKKWRAGNVPAPKRTPRKWYQYSEKEGNPNS